MRDWKRAERRIAAILPAATDRVNFCTGSSGTERHP